MQFSPEVYLIIEIIPYGDKVLYLVTFHCYNARNEGDYHNGIPPDYHVEDDLTHPLGSTEEGMTKAALEYLGRDYDAPL